MIPIKNVIKVEEIDDNNVKKELLFEDTIKNTVWYIAEENRESLIIDSEKCITKFETDVLDNSVFYSTIEIMKTVAGQNGVLSSLQRQETFDSLKTSDLVNSNNEDINHTKTFCCDICGICFATDIHLKNHMEKHKKQTQVKFKCSFCDKKFKLNFSLNRHIQKYHLHRNGLNEKMKTNKNNCSEKKANVILKLKLYKLNGVWKCKTNNLYKCNICFKQFHNENNLVEHESMHTQHSDSNESTVSGDLVIRDRSINVEKGKSLSTNATESINSNFSNTANSDESTLKIAKHDLTVINTCESVKKEKDLFTETNNSVRNCVDITNKRIVQTLLPNINIKKKPDDLSSATILTSISEPSNVGNLSSFATNISYEKKKQTKVKFMCNICETSSIDRHLFALHMSSHNEGNMYECIVCDKEFPTVLLWSNHLTYHQQQVDLNLLGSHNIPNRIEFHIPDINAENMESQEHTKSSSSVYVNTNLNNSLNNSIKNKSSYCFICNKEFEHLGKLNYHLNIHSDNKPYSCRDCGRTFNMKGPYLNHERSHKHKNKFKCTYCKIEYISISYWKKHLLQSEKCRSHCKQFLPEFTSLQENGTKSMLSKCHICKKLYRTYYLKKHLKNIHKQFDGINLDTSTNVGLQKKELTTVVTIPQKSKILKKIKIFCSFCDKSYCNYSNLRQHIRITHMENEALECNICGTLCANIYAYRRHMSRYAHK